MTNLPKGELSPDVDEGYDEQRMEIPDWMTQWADEQKAEFAYQLLLSVTPRFIEGVISRLNPLLYKDFISCLPHELALHILHYTDIRTLGRASVVCKDWKQAINDSGLWRHMYMCQGWQVKEFELNNDLEKLEIDWMNHSPSGLGEMVNGYDGEDMESRSSSSEVYISSHHLDVVIENNPEFSLCDDSIQRMEDISFELDSESSNFTMNVKTTNTLVHSTPRSDSQSHNSTMSGPILANAAFLYLQESRGLINWKYLIQQRAKLDYNWMHAKHQLRRLPGHVEGIYCIQFDEAKIISGSRDHTIKIWDIQSGCCISTYRGHTASVLCLQYDDEIIVSGSSDSTVIIWNLVSGEIIRVLTGHTEPVLNLSFDQKYIVTCSKDRTIRVWDRKTGVMLRTLIGHRIAVNAVQFKDGIIVSASGDRTIMMWDLESGRCLRTFVGHTRGIACVQYDGEVIISGSKDKTIKIWDPHSGNCVKTLIGHTELVRTLQFNDKVILSGSYDRTIKIWDRKSGELLGDLKDGHACRVFKAQFDCTKVVSCSQDHHVLIWDFAHDVDATYLV